MDPNVQNSPFPPNPNQPPAFPAGQQASKPPQKLNTKPLIVAAIAAGAIMAIGMIVALAWPKKKPAPPPPAPETITQYYYVEDVKGEDGKKDSFSVTIAFANPVTGAIDKRPLQTVWPLTWSNAQPLQFTADGSNYMYSTSDKTTADPGRAPVDGFRLITGKWPQEKASEKVMYADTKRNDDREWLMTKDGKEAVFLDIVVNDKKEITTSDLYSIDVAAGKATKIGAVDRPPDNENTRLYEFTKDQSIRFYTSKDDGLYETRYDRKTRKLVNKKVVIRDYDFGTMGYPSPDGTKMLYFGNGQKNFTVYLLDLVEGGATPLVSTPAKYGSYRGGHWSPDSKSVALTADIKDVDGKHYENQLLLVDTTVKSTEGTTMISRNKSPGADNNASMYVITSWSPNGTYLTYVQNKQLHFYDLKAGKTIDTVKIGHEIDPNMVILGWVSTVKTK